MEKGVIMLKKDIKRYTGKGCYNTKNDRNRCTGGRYKKIPKEVHWRKAKRYASVFRWALDCVCML